MWVEDAPIPIRTPATTPRTGDTNPARGIGAAAAAMSAAGLFRPLTASHPAVHYPGKGLPRGKWARRVQNYVHAGCPEVPSTKPQK
jgi:hypothetical protein